MRKILVAVDGSPAAWRAARYATTLAKSLGATVTAVHVIPWDLPEPGGRHRTALAGLKEERARDAERLLSTAARKLRRRGVTVQTRILWKQPGRTIAAFSDAERFDLVVLGSRGRGRLTEVVFGSVASEVLHLCHRPILIVR